MQPDLTIFSIPKPFTDKTRGNQKNAINSWRRLSPTCEIILFGGDDECAEFMRETGNRHVPEVTCSSLGTPLLDDVFAKAQAMARGRVLMFTNCDMLYFDDLPKAIARVPFDRYMLCGRRWDLDVSEELAFNDEDAWKGLREKIGREGRLHGHSGLDFFIFPRALRIDMPPMVVGRPGWDSWFMWYLRAQRIPVIDATGSIRALHQNHDYTHLKFGAQQYTGLERQINYRLAGGYMHMLGLREADWRLSAGQVVRPSWPGRALSLLAPTWAYRFALSVVRNVRQGRIPPAPVEPQK